MKKRLWLIGALAALALLAASCQKVVYEAYVTIVNIGNVDMTAWVDGDAARIPAYDSLTWAVSLETENESLQLHLEAEPVGGGDYDDAVVVLHGDRDIVTWLTGWDVTGGSRPQKKESRVLNGPAPSLVTSDK